MTNPTPVIEDAHAQAVRVLEIEMSGLVARFRQAMRDSAECLSPGLHPGAYKTFATIALRGPITSSALAELLFLDKSLLSRTVRTLEELDLIERTPDPTDGRSSLLSVTASGRERLEALRATHRSPLLDRLAQWPLEDVRRLAVLLHALGTGEQPGLYEDLAAERLAAESAGPAGPAGLGDAPRDPVL
ncbi:SMC-Scp complex subunit ScpB [Microbacterium sp. X-17]|uniref:MarR family winged helix-turn-helix transcriptional regulator n=1 Tax=Microbacterium sp. X-17 TaxID=3144404 RepID=UPI0031F4CD5D